MSRCYVNVRFRNDLGYTASKAYVYLADGKAEDLQNHKMAIVDSPSSGYVVVDIVSITDLDESLYNGKTKYIVQFVDDTEYLDRIARAKRREAIEKELRRLHEEREKAKKLEDLVADMPEAASLIEELKSLK